MLKSGHFKRALFVMFFALAAYFLGHVTAQQNNTTKVRNWVDSVLLVSIEKNIRPYWLTDQSTQSTKLINQLDTNIKKLVMDLSTNNLNLPKQLSTLSLQSIAGHTFHGPINPFSTKLDFYLTLGEQQYPISFTYQQSGLNEFANPTRSTFITLALLILIILFFPRALSAKESQTKKMLEYAGIPKNEIQRIHKQNTLANINTETFESLTHNNLISWQDAIRLSCLPNEKNIKLVELIQQEIHPFEAETLISTDAYEALDINWYKHLRKAHQFEVEDAQYWALNSRKLEISSTDGQVIVGGITGKLKPKEKALLLVIIDRKLSGASPISSPRVDEPDVNLGKELADTYELLKGSRGDTLRSFQIGLSKEELTSLISEIKISIKKTIDNDILAERFFIQARKTDRNTVYVLELPDENIHIS